MKNEIFFIINGKEIPKKELTKEEQREIKIKLKDRFMKECGYEKAESKIEKSDK